MHKKHPKSSIRKAKQKRSQDTIEVILDAAAHILTHDGYASFTTNQIAETAGVSIGSIYQYFPNKDLILSQLIDRHMHQINSVFESKMLQVVGAPLPEAIKEVVTTILAVHAVNPKLHRALNEQIPKAGQADKLEELHRNATTLLRYFLELRKDQLRIRNLDLAAFIIVEATDSVIHSVVQNSPELLKDEKLKEELSDLLLRYLAP